jgi:hypothetical protein
MEQEEGDRHTSEMRECRNETIEAEVEIRRARADSEKVQQALIQDEKDFQAKLDELYRIKRQFI